jgi:hypothetical protein
MKRIVRWPVTLTILTMCAALAQTNLKSPLVGTVTNHASADEIEIKPDGGSAIALKLKPETVAQRVAPGEKDLKNAAAIQASEVAAGDRVLVNLFPDSRDVRRIVVMPATEISKRNEADRTDWMKRGAGGVVVSKAANQITVRMRTMTGEQQAIITVNEKTSYHRYAPDSVKFADAKSSALGEVSVGDQLRARGQKSDDALKVDAEDVVFGTFLTKAGAITAVNAEAREITIQDLATKKPMIVRLAPDSQLKKMPDFGAMMGGGPPGGAMPGGMRPQGMGGAPPAGAASTGTAGGGMPGLPRGAAPDMAQMLERMPAAKLEELKPGDTILVSSTMGAQADHITAILLVSNAGMLIQMAQMQSGGNRPAGMNGLGAPSMGMGGMTGALEMPGMMQ